MAGERDASPLDLPLVWRSGLEQYFYNDHDRKAKVNGFTSNLVALLRSWVRCFTMIRLSLLGGIWQAAN